MLSYRHIFHAGNHADVLKHTILVHSLAYLTAKDKPLRVIDTHAGAGVYNLKDKHAQTNREFNTGISQLWQAQDAPPLIADYLQQIRTFNGSGPLTRYPGSPGIAQQLLRTSDKLYLHELHGTDCARLREALGGDRRISIREEDGFAGLLSLLPPSERRALVLIDPSYEIKNDYRMALKNLQQAHRRFAQGTYALWYPVVSRERIDELEHGLRQSGIRDIQLFELGVAPDSVGHGMTASGMILINPPWTLWPAMAEALPWLARTLGGDQGHYRQVRLADE